MPPRGVEYVVKAVLYSWYEYVLAFIFGIGLQIAWLGLELRAWMAGWM